MVLTFSGLTSHTWWIRASRRIFRYDVQVPPCETGMFYPVELSIVGYPSALFVRLSQEYVLT